MNLEIKSFCRNDTIRLVYEIIKIGTMLNWHGLGWLYSLFSFSRSGAHAFNCSVWSNQTLTWNWKCCRLLIRRYLYVCFRNGARATNHSSDGHGGKLILLDHVGCVGNEQHLADLFCAVSCYLGSSFMIPLESIIN